MEKLKITTIILLITGILLVNPLILTAKSQIPPLPMIVYGYVFIHRITCENVTAPAGLHIYAKVGTEVLQPVEGSQDVTDENGYYMLGITGPSEGTPIDLWVEKVYVETIILRYYTDMALNLTVMDTIPPTIEIISPMQGEMFPPNQQVWINATLTDDLAIDVATIKLTLNGTVLSPAYNPQTGLLYYQTNPLTSGYYIASLSVKDLAENLATKTWSFRIAEAVPPEPPVLEIISPTTVNPVYTQADRTIQVTYQYTEASPKNVTIKIYNSTHTLAIRTITGLSGGTNVQRTDVMPIPAGAADGSYHLNVTICNIHDLGATASQLNAVKVDNTKPVISNPYQDPPGQMVQPGETVDIEFGYNITVRVNITEPNIEKVSLYYNISATEWVEIPMTPAASGEYVATITSSSLPLCTTIQ